MYIEICEIKFIANICHTVRMGKRSNMSVGRFKTGEADIEAVNSEKHLGVIVQDAKTSETYNPLQTLK